MKNILITGANSYIGCAVERRLNEVPSDYIVTTLDMMGDSWKNHDFSKYDVVYHVAGIAHSDVGNATEEQKKLYYAVNTDLAVDVAEKAKESGVKQFIFMSSMIVYSGCKVEMITKDTVPVPLNFYGDSKWQADQKIRKLASESFKVAVLRPPMIYGKDSKGNYPVLAKFATKLPLFPKVDNRRSMLYIGNLCEFVKLIIDNCDEGIFFPQNAEYTNTSVMVKKIAEARNHRIIIIPGFYWLIKMIARSKGKVGTLFSKAFGSSCYDLDMSRYEGKYQLYDLEDSIKATEGEKI